MSSLPIQDRIYRSRLTIKYRTNIDGVPVPQTLPLRLLVLGDLTGGKPSLDPAEAKARPTPPLTQDRLIPNRRIVSVLRGMAVDDILGEMNVAFPIPPSNEPSLALLRERAYVAGTFGGDDQEAAPLEGSLDEIDSDGALGIAGTIPFSATVHDNAPIHLAGPLEVALGVAFQKVEVQKTTSVTFKGRADVPLGDDSKLDTVVLGAVAADPTDAGKLTIQLTSGTAKVWHADQASGAAAWLDLPIKAGSQLGGAKPKEGDEAGWKAQGSVIITVEGREYLVDAAASIPLARDAGGVFTPAPSPAVQSYKLSGHLNIAVTATVTFDKLFDPATPGAVIGLAVQRQGNLQKAFVPAAGVALANDDTTPKSSSDATPQKMPAYTATGTLTGTLDGVSVKSLFGTDGLRSLSNDTPVSFDFSVHVTFTTAAQTSYLLGGVVAGAQGKVELEIKGLHGRVWGAKDELASASVPVRPEDIVLDVDAAGADVSKCRMTLHEVLVGDKSDFRIKVRLDGACDAYRSVRIKNLDSFSPDAVAVAVPEIRRLQILSDLLLQLKSDVNLIPSVRASVGQLLTRANGKMNVLRSKLLEIYPPLDIGDRKTVVAELNDEDKTWFRGFLPDRVSALVKAAQIKDKRKEQPLALVAFQPAATGGLSQLDFHDYDTSAEHRVSDEDRLVTGLAALLVNDLELDGGTLSSQLGDRIDAVIDRIGLAVGRCVSHVLMDPQFRALERNWRDVAALCSVVETDKTVIDLLDLGPDELTDDMKEHASDIFTSELFKRLYPEEYDRYGGKPFGAMIGLYHIENGDADIDMLTTVSEIANAAHCPFITAVAPTFFGSDIESWSDLDSVGDIEAHLNLPKFGKWNALRDSGEAPYLGLTLPGYLSRKPWGSEEKQLGNRLIGYDETTGADVRQSYLWGSSAILFAQNLVRSFEASGWCQYIRGVKGGGLIQGMTVHTVVRHGKEETQSPVEFEIPDYRELQFSKGGLIPLVHCKGSADAAFFSAQSIKKPRDFRSELDTQNAYLVTNLAYTFSITRIAHYVKRMMRDYIGSTADGAYIQKVLQLWLNDYITTTVNPDDLTLRVYPFKAVSVSVVNKPGPLGWYKAIISILPHVQFEGMDVELRLEAALGGK